MGKVLDQITPELREFIAAQPLFFVGSAPLSGDGHINLSPKGLDCFRVLTPHRVGYLDLTGSGNETSAHLLENGRITFMFCAFGGAPNIVRLYGRGRVILPTNAEWEALHPLFTPLAGARQIIVAEIERVQESCGFGVPRMDLIEPRDTLVRWAETKGEAGLEDYRTQKNLTSMDGLPTPLSERFSQ